MKYTELQAAKYLELLFSCDGVKFYRIRPTGEVTQEFDESTIRIVRMEKDDNKNLDSTIFIQAIQTCHTIRIEHAEAPLLELGDIEMQTDTGTQTEVDDTTSDPSWIYPLIPGVSPCYRTEYGAFIFPDLETSDGSAVGLVIPEAADDVVLEILVDLLHGVMKKGGVIEFGDLSAPRARRGIPETVSKSFVKGAYYVSKGLVSIFSKKKILI